MRLFIAFDVSKRNKKLISQKVSKINNNIDQNLKWVNKENWHLTLKFLGDTDPDKLKIIEQSMKEISKEYKNFSIQFSGLNAFPDINHPRVLYLEINKGYKILCDIYNDLEKKLTEKSFAPDQKKYTPHLTIARSYKNTDYKKLFQNLKNIKENIFINIYNKIKNIHLYESKLLPEGPVYKKIYKFSLKNLDF